MRLRHSLMSSTAIGLAFFGVLSAARAQTDDSAWINQGIRAALQSRKTSYVLPARDLYLSSPITIPGGTRNFALRGSKTGTGATKLIPLANMGHMIAIGYGTNLNARTAYPLQNVADRARTVDLVEAAPLARGNYLLSDATTLRGSQKIRFELVQARAYDAARKRLTLASTVGREFDHQPTIRNIDGLVSENIRVENITMDARGTGKTVDGMVKAILVRGITYRYLNAYGFKTNGIVVELSTRATIERCVVDASAETTYGEGYGIQVNQTRYASVRYCEGNYNRHTVMICGGSTDVVVMRVTSRHSQLDRGTIDLHGSDERRVRIEYSTANLISLGNTHWGMGAKDVTLRGVTAPWLAIRPNVQRVLVQSSAFNRVYYEWGGDPGLRPQDPVTIDDIRFVKTTFKATNWGSPFAQNNIKVGRISFLQCEFQTERFPAITSNDGTASFTFTSCKFGVNTTNPFLVLDNPSGTGNYSIRVVGNQFTVTAGMQFAIDTKSTFIGTVTGDKNNIVVGPSNPALARPGVAVLQ